MARRRKEEQQPQEVGSLEVDFPILPSDIQIGLFTTPEGAYAILNCSNVLVRGTFPLDRAQTIQLGSQLLKLGRRMPKDPKRIESVAPEGEVVTEGGLIVPSAS